MEFGQKLKEARLRAGLTQEDIVRRIGVSRQTVSNWENDRSYPDLGSAVKLSELYGLSLDELLKEDDSLQRAEAQRKEQVKRYLSYLHDFALLLIASNFVLAWLGETTAGVILGALGIGSICTLHVLFVVRLGAEWKAAALRCLALVIWSAGFMLRVQSHHSNQLGDLLCIAGLTLECYGDLRLKWDVFYPKHMTVFTGFVIALVLVFTAIPMVGDLVTQGEHIEGQPFTGRDYLVAEVLQGDDEPVPRVYLGSTNRVWLDYPGETEVMPDGKFVYIPQPDGASHKGIWEMIPEDAPDTLYRVTLGADNDVTMACLENGRVSWEYLLELAPKAGCTVIDVLGTAIGTIDWYEYGSFDADEVSGGLPLRGKGTVKISVPGEDETVTIYEELHIGDAVEHQTLTLTKDQRGFVEFKREARDSDESQWGIYRIPYGDGEFILILKYTP